MRGVRQFTADVKVRWRMLYSCQGDQVVALVKLVSAQTIERDNDLPFGFLLLLNRRQQAGLRVAAAALRPWLFCPADDAFVVPSMLITTSAS